MLPAGQVYARFVCCRCRYGYHNCGIHVSGWITGGTSEKLAAKAQGVTRGERVADFCVERFNAAPDSSVGLTELKALTSAFAIRQLEEAGSLATMPGQTTPMGGGREACFVALAA
jgi:hypothetical protein